MLRAVAGVRGLAADDPFGVELMHVLTDDTDADDNALVFCPCDGSERRRPSLGCSALWSACVGSPPTTPLAWS
uniref:Uncharacterized protein n=1 Tax=Oryza barthii TaxID=65489 RepID=A0A0D3HCP6_9ORYZ